MSTPSFHSTITDDRAEILQLAHDVAQLANVLDTDLIGYALDVAHPFVLPLMHNTVRSGSMLALPP